MGTYVIAMKPNKLRLMSLDEAFERISDIPSVEPVGDIGPYTVSIRADDRAVREIVRRLSKWCQIESEIHYYPQAVR